MFRLMIMIGRNGKKGCNFVILEFERLYQNKSMIPSESKTRAFFNFKKYFKNIIIYLNVGCRGDE